MFIWSPKTNNNYVNLRGTLYAFLQRDEIQTLEAAKYKKSIIDKIYQHK